MLYVNTPGRLGGAEISLLILMSHLHQARYRPHLLTRREGVLAVKTREQDIPVTIQDFPWFSKRRFWEYPLSIFELTRTIEHQDIELVHTNCDHSLRYVMRACGLMGVPYVSHVRDFVRSWFQPDKVEALMRAERVIANSEAVVQACLGAGVERARVRVIYNPIETDAFQKVSRSTAAALREELGIPVQALVVGIVGQIQAMKGHQTFVDAALQFLGEEPDARFLVVGEPHGGANEHFLSRLKDAVKAAGQTETFCFTGFRDDIPAVMHAIDVLTVPSWNEPFGRVAVEGMAAGCAVVAADTGGLPEIVTDGLDGLLVPPKDVDALASALTRLARDSALRRRLSEGGHTSAERFAAAKHVQRVEAVYDAVLSEG